MSLPQIIYRGLQHVYGGLQYAEPSGQFEKKLTGPQKYDRALKGVSPNNFFRLFIDKKIDSMRVKLPLKKPPQAINKRCSMRINLCARPLMSR